MLRLDCGDWWVFPVFKPTYGLSKAVAERLLFFLHYIFTSSFFFSLLVLFHRLSLPCFSWLCCENTDQSFGSCDEDIRPKQSPLKTSVAKCILIYTFTTQPCEVTTPTDPFCGFKITWVCPQNCLIYLTRFCKLGLSTLEMF